MSQRRIPVEELLDFPTEFQFKVVGHHTLAFPPQAEATVRAALGDDRPIDSRSRLSRRARYVSVSLTTRLDSAAELKAVYAALRDLDGAITVL